MGYEYEVEGFIYVLVSLYVYYNGVFYDFSCMDCFCSCDDFVIGCGDCVDVGFGKDVCV